MRSLTKNVLYHCDFLSFENYLLCPQILLKYLDGWGVSNVSHFRISFRFPSCFRPYRSDTGRWNNLGGPVVIGWDNLPSPTRIGLTDRQIWEASGPPGPPRSVITVSIKGKAQNRRRRRYFRFPVITKLGIGTRVWASAVSFPAIKSTSDQWLLYTAKPDNSDRFGPTFRCKETFGSSS